MSAMRRMAVAGVRLICLALFLVGATLADAGTWVAKGLTGVDVRDLAIDPANPSTVYAATDTGVHKSTDAAGSWNPANAGLTSLNVFAFAIDPSNPSTLYAGTLGGEVFKSTDGAASWNVRNIGLPDDDVFILRIDPSAPSTVFAGTASGLFKSTNGGDGWEPANTGLPLPRSISALAIDPSVPSIIYAGSDAGVFRSTNGGSSWDPAGSGIPSGAVVSSLAIDPASPNTLYAGTIGFGLFKSTDSGGSWTPRSSGLGDSRITEIAIDPVAPATLYAGTRTAAIFKSTNGGSSWTPFNTGLSPTVFIRSLVVDPTRPLLVYAGTFYQDVFAFDFCADDACNDGNPCTIDTCDPAIGCRHEGGMCWAIGGRLTATACSQGRCQQQRGRFAGALLLLDDGRYVVPSSGSACGADAPDEVGTSRPGRRGRLVLEPGNLEEIVAAANACLDGFSLRLRRYRHRVRIAPGGSAVRGVVRIGGSVRVQGRPVSVAIVARYSGNSTSGAP